MVWSGDNQNPLWGYQNCAGWGDGVGETPKLVIYDTLSETFAAQNNLRHYPAHHLFLGVNPETGLAEAMDMKNPRSLVIKDDDHAGNGPLLTMAMAIKLRASQSDCPITALTYDYNSWGKLKNQFGGITIASPGGDGISLIRKLPHIKSPYPHFLFIDDLAELVNWGPNEKSIMNILLGSGAESMGIYVLAMRGPTGNIKSENILDGLVGGYDKKILNAETLSYNIIKLANGRKLQIPKAK